MKASTLLPALAVALAACGPTDAGQRTALAQPAAATVADTTLPVMTIYKTPTCGCCQKWVEHVQQAGFRVEVHDLNDLAEVKREHGVPGALQSCHTALVGRYVIEGHVPAGDIRRLLTENRDVAGLAVPGMPAGSPGMEGFYKQKYDVFAFTKDGQGSVFASH